MSMKHANYLGVPEAAKLLGVPAPTLRNWVKQGKIQGMQYFEQGKIFIPRSEVERMQANLKPKGVKNAE